MLFSKKMITLASATLVAVSVVSMAQDAPASKGQTIVVSGAIDWVEKSDVSALKEGVIKQIEFQVGRIVKKGEPIGYLHDEMAILTEAKAKLAAENTGEIAKAEAQRGLAKTELARLKVLRAKGEGFVSQSEYAKAEADLNLADAVKQVAMETKKLYEVEHALAKRAVEEHIIRAPFSGVITDRMKNPEESVRANEPVVRIGGIERLRFVGWIPLEVAVRLKGNEPVEVRPVVEGIDLPIEEQKFSGKLTMVGHEVHTNLRSTEVQVLAEIAIPFDPEHPEAILQRPELILRPGTKGDMTIFVGGAPAKVASRKQP